MSRGLAVAFTVAVSLAAASARAERPAGMSKLQAAEAKNITGFMKMLVGRHVTPPFAVVPHSNDVDVRVLRMADRPGLDPWAQVRLVTPGEGVPKSVTLRGLLPAGAHVGATHDEKLANAERFGGSTRFRLAVVHEDGSFAELGSPLATGIVTQHDFEMPLKRGRNLLVVLPQHTEPSALPPARVANLASRRVLELVVGSASSGRLTAPMLGTLRELGLYPYQE
jgi:hypothetical protein